MKYLPKIQQLKTFQEVIRRGSIRAAARALNQSQPAISRAIKELEHTLNTQLIVRGAKGMMLTETGSAFAARSQLILEELQRAADEIEQISQYSQGSVSVGFSSLIALTVFPRAADTFKNQFPQANIHAKEAQLSTLLPDLREGRLDFAIGTLTAETTPIDLVREPLFESPFCIIAHRDNPFAQAKSLEELKHAKWLIPETDMGYYQQLESAMGNFYHQLSQSPIRTDSVVCGLSMVQQAQYLTIVARTMRSPLGLENTLCSLPIDDLPTAQYCVFYSQKSPLTLTARRFLDLLRWECQNYVWE